MYCIPILVFSLAQAEQNWKKETTKHVVALHKLPITCLYYFCCNDYNPANTDYNYRTITCSHPIVSLALGSL